VLQEALVQMWRFTAAQQRFVVVQQQFKCGQRAGC
jgi:hypothetical protein